MSLGMTKNMAIPAIAERGACIRKISRFDMSVELIVEVKTRGSPNHDFYHLPILW
jgi:hypothetical protein